MGTWDIGVFGNDGAADFLDEAQFAPSRAVTRALRALSTAKADSYVEVDFGSAAFAAAEIVAMAFGRGAESSDLDAAVEVAERVKPTESLRVLAIEAVDRLVGANSELMELWSEGTAGDGGRSLRASVAELRGRLEDCRSGPKPVRKMKAGDVFVAEVDGRSFVVQYVASREVVVFEGTCVDDADARRVVGSALGRRVPCEVTRELRGARFVANVPVSKAHRGKRLYGITVGTIEGYALVNGAFGGWTWSDFETASRYEPHQYRSRTDLARISDGTFRASRLESPDEREEQIRSLSRASWVERRRLTSPGPFGDDVVSRRHLEWVREWGVANALVQLGAQARGESGFGRPNEDAERSQYVSIALVAVWRGTLSSASIPETLVPLVPEGPPDLGDSVAHARTLVDQILVRESELRMMWEEAPDGGDALRREVAALRQALSKNAG